MEQNPVIIGNTVKIKNIEVAQYDFPNRMSLQDAKNACKALGDGWRLPTKDELNTLYQNKNLIGGFADGDYWSSIELYDYNYWTAAWAQYFYNGNQVSADISFTLHVRAIRDF